MRVDEVLTSLDLGKPFEADTRAQANPGGLFEAETLFTMPASLTMKFFTWTLPIFFVCRTYPTPGKFARNAFTGWVTSMELNFTLPDGVDFPLTCKAYRRPMAYGSKVSGGKRIDIDEPSTWEPEARMRGVVHPIVPYRGSMVALCTHKPRCPVTLDLPGGIIMHGDEPWIMCTDREVLPESEFAEMLDKVGKGQSVTVGSAPRVMEEAPLPEGSHEPTEAELAMLTAKPKDASAGEAVEMEKRVQKNAVKEKLAAQVAAQSG